MIFIVEKIMCYQIEYTYYIIIKLFLLMNELNILYNTVVWFQATTFSINLTRKQYDSQLVEYIKC